MGLEKTYKKQRKYTRQNANRIFSQFQESFSFDDYIKPCPKFIPKFFWNILIWLIVKKK